MSRACLEIDAGSALGHLGIAHNIIRQQVRPLARRESTIYFRVFARAAAAIQGIAFRGRDERGRNVHLACTLLRVSLPHHYPRRSRE
jgi:hypothetical protein